MPLPKEIDRFLALFGINHRFIIGDTRYRARRDGILEKESQPPEETGRIYMYAPRSWGTMLERWQLQAVLLSLYMGSPGFLLVSRSLEAYPAVGLRDIGDQIFFSSSLGSSLEEFLQRRAGGRLMRLPPAPPDGRLINFETDSFMKGKIKTTPVRPMAVLSSGKAAGGGAGFMPPFRKKKKLIFVLPTFLAVGGVERNTIEVITQSRDSYDFVIINFEPLNPSLGSLHHQFGPEVEGIYDLPEITGRGEFIPALRNLRAVYDPDLVWICNGSPWLHRNLTKVRSLFEDIPIVDQQVYDTGEGWINIFHERGIHSFDRFIAINSKIRDAFVDVYHIEKEKIDLIYHAIDLKRIEEATEKREEARSISEKHRLPPDKKLFLFIGRMTPQKRPLDFLQFAEGEQALGNEGDHFVMIGDGELSGTVKDFIRERVLSNVTYIPFIENPMEIMAVAGGLIILSQYEGLPIAMLEALAMGLPVLSTDVGDVRLVLEEYNSGMVIDKTGDIEEIQHRFKAWKRDLEFFSERAREGAKHVRERFSGRSVAMHYGDTWKRAMEQKGRAVQ
jgi:glycosyltransferase involved in cell wall biosynthesis